MADKMMFAHSCVDSDGPSIRDMVEKSQSLSRKTFLQYVDKDNLEWIETSLGYVKHPSQGLTMAGDFHVSYSKSVYRGSPCVYFTHSAIEYIFC